MAGAGGGTLLVLLAKNLPDTNPYKPWLVICAPATSVFSGSVLLWLKTKINAYFERRAFKAEIDEARKTLAAALDNPATTEAHKKKMRESLEKLEKLTVDTHLSRVQELAE